MEFKIGIITYHRALNNGAVLQATALQKYLSELSCDVRIIDYRCKKIEKVFKFRRNIVKLFYELLNSYIGIFIKRLRFNRFIENHLKITESIYNYDELVNGLKLYDGFITGSDQVFAPVFTDFDSAYFLNFASEKQKVLSYAASIGSVSISESYYPEYRERLLKFPVISVREQRTKDFIEKVYSGKIVENIDPVFLLSKNEWNTICAQKKTEKNYVLVYYVQQPIELLKYARRVAHNNNYELIIISDKIAECIGNSFKGFACDPSSFLSLIKNASLILTNSFHGTAFSIIFQKEFMVEINSRIEVNNRIISLLERLGIEDRSLERHKSFKDLKPVDWRKVNQKMEIEQKRTADYFYNYLFDCSLN